MSAHPSSVGPRRWKYVGAQDVPSLARFGQEELDPSPCCDKHVRIETTEAEAASGDPPTPRHCLPSIALRGADWFDADRRCAQFRFHPKIQLRGGLAFGDHRGPLSLFAWSR